MIVQASPTVNDPLKVAVTAPEPPAGGATVPVKLPLPRAPPLFTMVNVPLTVPAMVTVPVTVMVLICGPEFTFTVPVHEAPVCVGTTNVPLSIAVPLLAGFRQLASVS